MWSSGLAKRPVVLTGWSRTAKRVLSLVNDRFDNLFLTGLWSDGISFSWHVREGHWKSAQFQCKSLGLEMMGEVRTGELMMWQYDSFFCCCIRVKDQCWQSISVLSRIWMRSHPTCWKWYVPIWRFLERYKSFQAVTEFLILIIFIPQSWEVLN